MEQETPITPPRPRGRLLLVEDDAAIRRLIATALTDEGYETVAAQDGATRALWGNRNSRPAGGR